MQSAMRPLHNRYRVHSGYQLFRHPLHLKQHGFGTPPLHHMVWGVLAAALACCDMHCQNCLQYQLATLPRRHAEELGVLELGVARYVSTPGSKGTRQAAILQAPYAGTHTLQQMLLLLCSTAPLLPGSSQLPAIPRCDQCMDMQPLSDVLHEDGDDVQCCVACISVPAMPARS